MERASGERGHRQVPHTADTRIEAWAQTREECLAEAVTALVSSFADVDEVPPSWTVSTDLSADSDTDALVAVLDEVIYVLDTQGGVPVRAELSAAPTGLGLRLHLAPVDQVAITGAVPKAVTLNDLHFSRSDTGWTCAATIDV